MRRELFLPWNRPRWNRNPLTSKAITRMVRAGIARLNLRPGWTNHPALDRLPRLEASRGYVEFAARNGRGLPR